MHKYLFFNSKGVNNSLESRMKKIIKTQEARAERKSKSWRMRRQISPCYRYIDTGHGDFHSVFTSWILMSLILCLKVACFWSKINWKQFVIIYDDLIAS